MYFYGDLERDKLSVDIANRELTVGATVFTKRK